MKKYLIIFPAILLAILGAGFLLWAQIGADRVDYPDAKEYAPNFWFDSEEKYYPTDPLDFYFDKSGNELPGKTAVAEYDKLSLDEKLGKVKVFYNISDAGDEIVYQYWLFYVMNNYENGHYGDWESVFIFVDKETKNINKAVGSAHGSGHVLEIKSEATRHIWVYVGNGSHASCPDEVGDGNCDFWIWRFGRQGRDWMKSDKEKEKKLIYTSYNSEKIEQSYIDNFGEEKSFNKEKSPTLGVNLYKTFGFSELKIPHPKEEKYINPPLVGNYFGQTPTFAWAKEEYNNPQKILIPAHTRLARNIGGFFADTGNFIAAAGKTIVSPITNLFTTGVEESATDIKGQAFTASLSKLTVDVAKTETDVGGQTPPRRGLTPTPAPVSSEKISPSIPFRAGQQSADINSEAGPEFEFAFVTRVIDGDTVELASGQRLRYIGIDTPELPDNCFAKEAAEKNRELVENKQIILLKGSRDIDNYGRLLRFVWQDTDSSGTLSSDDLFINRALIEEGYAHAFTYGETHAYEHVLESAEAAAKRERLGLWGDACLPKEAVDLQPAPRVLIYEPPTTPAPPDPIDLTAPTSTIAVANYEINKPEFQVQWNTTADDLAYYEVQSKIGNSGIWQYWGGATTTLTSKNYSGATNGTYYFRVRGTDFHQNIGPWQEGAGVVIDLYQVVINEIQINDSEFLELYNFGSSTTSLAEYYFSYFPSNRILWNDPFRNKKFPDSASIGGGSYYLIGLEGYATTTGNPRADWQAYTSKQLGNSQGTVALFPFDPTSASSSQYAYDNRVDAIGWGSGLSLYEGASATTAPAAGQSLTRNNSHADTDNNSADFTIATSTTPINSAGETYIPPPPPSNPIWAMYQKDARHSGLATLSGPSWTSSAQATSTWVFPMDSAASSPPVIDGEGIVYAMDGEGKVYAINANGTQKWKFDPKIQGGNGAGWASASPAISSDGQRVYSTYTDTSINKLVLYSIKISDGTLDWKYSVTGANETFTSPILDSNGNIYVASNSKLYSISPAGSFRWDKLLSDSGIGVKMPAVGNDGYVYVVGIVTLSGGDRYLWKLNANDGSEVWKINPIGTNSLLNSVSINATGTIFTGGNKDARLYAVSPSTGLKLWETILVSGDVVNSIPNFDSLGNVYIGTSGAFDVGAFNKVSATGTLLWAFTEATPGAVTQPAVLDSQDRVYFGAKDKFVYALKGADGAIIWKYQLSDEPRGFAIGNGRLYVASYDGKVYAL